VDSASANLEREIRRWRGKEEGALDMRGHGVSDPQGEAVASARELAGPAALTGLSPKQGSGERADAALPLS
jgi:hypothetical protein